MWRRDIPALKHALTALASRPEVEGGGLIGMFRSWAQGHPFDATAFEALIPGLMIPSRPHRFQVVTLQRMAELAMLIDQPDHALMTLRAAADFGLIDIVWLDACPLFASLPGDPRFGPIRADVAARAASVLAAFRAASR